MSIAVGIGYIVAYPVNDWLVNVCLKHGMSTERVFGKGGSGLVKEKQRLSAPSSPVHANPASAMAMETGRHDQYGCNSWNTRMLRRRPATAPVTEKKQRPLEIALEMEKEARPPG